MKELKVTRRDAVMVALVDDEDYAEFSKYAWRVSTLGYVIRTEQLRAGVQETFRMHREVMGLARGDGTCVDHINECKLDNQKHNLRLCSKAENVRNRKRNPNNTSGFKGVSWDKRQEAWVARITTNRKVTHIGYYSSAEEAYTAYCATADKQHGNFANHGNGCTILEDRK